MELVSIDENHNCILGYQPLLKESHIIFKGKNNILICEENVKLSKSTIKFFGDNSIVYLAPAKHEYYLKLDIFHNCVFFFDEGFSTNGILRISLSEEKNILIGKDCLFSFGVWMRLANPHLLYSAKDMQRISLTESLFIGDHVWIGQDSLILKGSEIGSGSVIAARSIVSNKKVPSNTLWGGNPIRKISDDIFFDNYSSNVFTKETAKEHQTFDSDKWIYKNEGEVLSFKEIDERLSSTWDLDEKIELLLSIRNNKSHNRFYVE